MKKYLIPGTITALAIGAFLVFQNAGIVSPSLGTWTTVAKLSQLNSSGVTVGVSQVPKFDVSILNCELRLKYVYEAAGLMGAYGGSASKKLVLAVEHPNRVSRSSLGELNLQFSKSSGVGPFNFGMGSGMGSGNGTPTPMGGMNNAGTQIQSPASSQYEISVSKAGDPKLLNVQSSTITGTTAGMCPSRRAARTR